MATVMCKFCQGTMEQTELAFFTAIQPQRALKCAGCGQVAYIFTAPASEDVVLWNADQPPAQPFSDWVEEAVEETLGQRPRLHLAAALLKGKSRRR